MEPGSANEILERRLSQLKMRLTILLAGVHFGGILCFVGLGMMWVEGGFTGKGLFFFFLFLFPPCFLGFLYFIYFKVIKPLNCPQCKAVLVAEDYRASRCVHCGLSAD